MAFLIAVGVIVFAVVLVLLLSKKAREETVGICNYALEQSVVKQKNKQKILELFGKDLPAGRQEKQISNEQIRNMLGVSDRSVVRYMDELEKEGKVKQSGKTGRSVVYVLQGS